MPTVVLPASLTSRAGGPSHLGVDGATAGEVLQALELQQPGLKGWVLDEQGRLREHVNVFVNSQCVGLDHPVTDGDEVYVIHAISGGAPESGDREIEVLVGTRKGLFVLRGVPGGPLNVAERLFPGESVDYACLDPRTGTYLAAVTHGQYGPRVFHTEDPGGQWRQAEGPAFPKDAEATVERIWVVEPGVEDGVLWAGVAPAALFKSSDGGGSWQLNRALWDQPSRADWEGGLGGLTLHSICPWPDDPQKLSVAMSAVGVWNTADGGDTWERFANGLVPRYVPEEARETTTTHCVHKMQRSPLEPLTLYMQFHGGVYRSDDGGEHWVDIGSQGGLPADFGFPIVVDPRDPDRAFVIPLVADQDRVTPEGKIRVYRTLDRGATWSALGTGLPDRNAYATILRQAFCHDGRDPLGLYFGTESGSVYVSADDGDRWTTAIQDLPPITSVRCGVAA